MERDDEARDCSKPGWYARAPVAAIFDARLTDRQFRALCAVAAFTNAKTDSAFPSLGTIARLWGCTRQNVQARIRKACSLGYLECSRRKRPNGAHSTNMYTIRFPAVPFPVAENEPGDAPKVNGAGGIPEVPSAHRGANHGD